MSEKKQLTIVGLFAGIGGIELGFKQAGFQPIAANELDDAAVETYKTNHVFNEPFPPNLVHGDISDTVKVSAKTLVGGEKSKKVTVLAGGFPCQPFSVAGYRKGFDDERGNVFWHIHRLISELKPEVVFLENVKNLQNHDKGRTFQVIKDALRGITPSAIGKGERIVNPLGTEENPGYFVVEPKVLNASDFGIPQNRERIFILAFRDPKVAARFSFPDPGAEPYKIDREPLSNFIDFDGEVEEKYYYDEKRPFFDELKKEITSCDTIYQWRRQYVRANKSGLCPTLTANMGMGGHNVPLIRTSSGRIRKFTPKECFNLMGFTDFLQPEGMADSRLYKQAGNAVVVPVIRAIAQQVEQALQPGKKSK